MPRKASEPAAVFMPACVGSMFGPQEGFPGVTKAFLALCERAGIEVVVPEGINATCCSTPFASKGMTVAHKQMRARMESWLWEATDGGRLPVVVDAASCTEGLAGLVAGVEAEHGASIQVVDAIAFTQDRLMPTLPAPTRIASITVHPTCSTTRMGLTPALLSLAAAIAETVAVPQAWGCCGFAGDRGLLHPELTASATAAQAQQIRDARTDAYASANRTCEIGMTRATGIPYAHILEHLAIAIGLFVGPSRYSLKGSSHRSP
jgi:D-lactate dehydrogenase